MTSTQISWWTQIGGFMAIGALTLLLAACTAQSGHDHDGDHDHAHGEEGHSHDGDHDHGHGEEGHGHDDDHGHSHSDEESNGHGAAHELGAVEVGGHKFEVVRFGEVKPGTESAFQISGVGMKDDRLAHLSLYLWVENEAGKQLSAPAKGSLEAGGLHFHVTPREGLGTPFLLVLRLRDGSVDERAELLLEQN